MKSRPIGSGSLGDRASCTSSSAISIPRPPSSTLSSSGVSAHPSPPVSRLNNDNDENSPEEEANSHQSRFVKKMNGNRAASSIRCQSASTVKMNQRRQLALNQILVDSEKSATRLSSVVGRQQDVPAAGVGSDRPPTFQTQPKIPQRPNTAKARINSRPTISVNRGEGRGSKDASSSKLASPKTPHGKLGFGSPQEQIAALAMQIAAIRTGKTVEELEKEALANEKKEKRKASANGEEDLDEDEDALDTSFDADLLRSDEEIRLQNKHLTGQCFVSNRLLQERVSERLAFYRDNPQQRKFLKQRVSRFKAVRTGGVIERLDDYGLPAMPPEEVRNELKKERWDHIEKNGVTILDEFFQHKEDKFLSLKLSPRDGATWVAKNKERSDHHRSVANRVWREELAHKKAVIGRHDEILAEAAAKREEEEASLVACEWENALSLGSRARLFQKNFLLFQLFRKLQDSFLIRRQYFRNWIAPVKKLMYLRRRDQLQGKLQFAINSSLVWGRIAVKRRGVETLKRFVAHLNQAGRFHIAMQHYRKKVLKCQQYIRNYLRYRTVRLNLIMMMWDKKEEVMRYRLHEQWKSEMRRQQLTERRMKSFKTPAGKSGSGGAKKTPTTAASSSGSKKSHHHKSHHHLAAQDMESLVQAKVNSLIKNDPFKYDQTIPFSIKLKAITDNWVERRKIFVKKELRIRYYADKFEYEKKLARWEKLSSEPNGDPKTIPQRPAPPQLRPFPLFLPADKFDDLISSTMNLFREQVQDLRLQAANEVIRESRPEADYIPLRDQLMYERFHHDLLEKQKFFSRMHRVVFAKPSIKGPLMERSLGRGGAGGRPGESKPKLSVFVPQ